MTSFPRHIPLKDFDVVEVREAEDRILFRVLSGLLFLISLLWGLQPLNAEALALPVSITGQQLAQAAREGVLTSWKSAGYDAEVKVLRLPRDIQLEGSQVTLRVPCAEAKTGPLGNAGILVEILDNGIAVQSVLVSLQVKVLATIAVVQRSIPRHHVLVAEDIQWKHMALATSPSNFYQDSDHYFGKRTIQALTPDTLLSKRCLEEDPLVKKGEEVEVTSAEGPISISIRGVAERDGLATEIVQVRSLDTGRHLAARVIDATHLELARGMQ